MSRLTQEIKKELCRNLLEVSPLYQKAKDTLQKRADLVERIRKACLKQMKTSDAEIESIVQAVKSIKGIESFVTPLVKVARTATDKTSFVSVGINGQSRDLSLHGVDRLWERNRGTHYITDKEYFGKGISPARIPDRFVPLDRILLVKADKFNDELCASDVDINNLFGELEAFRLKVMGALREINTVKQLEKHWPEAVEYLPEIAKPAKKEIALSVDTLNAICGIPK